VTFPRGKARSLTIGGQQYRWAVGRVDEKFRQRLRVELADARGARLVCCFEERFNNDASPITPGRVRALVDRALHLGWTPASAGPEFVLDPCAPRERVFQAWAKKAPSFAEEPLALESWTDFDPIRRGFPWEHYVDVFARFRVWEGMTDIEVGTLFAEIAQRRHAVPGGDREKVLRTLLPTEEEEREDPLTYYIAGGRMLRRGDVILMDHGCCSSLDEWKEWRGFRDGGSSPWNGHDPFSSAKRVGDAILFFSDGGYDEYTEYEEVDAGTYAELVAGLEADMRGCVKRARQWLDRHAPEPLRAPVLAVLARTVHVEPG
jgi:hypothetical protein